MTLFDWIVLIAVIVASVMLETLLIVMLFKLTARYEQFRNEVAWVFQNQSEQMGDFNRRLTQAGYPPGRLESTNKTPDWYRNGQMPDGTPIPEQFRR
jgi:hypothetical protein